MREKVIFSTNVPVTVTLAFQDGLDVEGRFGDQVMYTLEDGRVMYVAPMVRTKIEELGIGKGQPFTMCKAERRNGSRRWIEWTVNPPVPPTTQEHVQKDHPDHAPRTAGATHQTQPANPNSRSSDRSTAQSNQSEGGLKSQARTNGIPQTPVGSSIGPLLAMPGVALAIQSALITGIDAAIAAEQYAAAKGLSLRFTSEDVRAIALTLFIQQAREGGSKWQR